MLRLEGFGKTERGQVREHNEDAFWVDNALGIFIVCDGMGGHAAGDVASNSVVNDLRTYLLTKTETLLSLKPEDPQVPETLKQLAQQAVEHANSAVYQMTQKNPGLRGMGTTLLLMLSCGPHAVIGHVGDSRFYLHREGKVYQLSTDHTLLQEFLNRGYIAPEEAKGHPHGNTLLRAVGLEAKVEVDLLYCEVLPGDTLVLCSDGLSRYLESSEELVTFCENELLEAIPGELTSWANQQGGRDNITAVVVRPKEEQSSDTLRVPTDEYSAFYKAMSLLQASPLTNNLSLQGQMRILNQLQTVTYEAGDTLYEPGDTVSALSLVLEGQVECSLQGDVVETINEGSDLFPMALLEPVTTEESISFPVRTTLLHLPGQQFRKILRRKPWLGQRLMRNLARELGQRLRKTRSLYVHNR